jgi:hypothetical protein
MSLTQFRLGIFRCTRASAHPAGSKLVAAVVTADHASSVALLLMGTRRWVGGPNDTSHARCGSTPKMCGGTTGDGPFFAASNGSTTGEFTMARSEMPLLHSLKPPGGT